MASSREETRGRSRFQAKYDDSDHDDLVSTLNIDNYDDDDDDGDDDDGDDDAAHLDVIPKGCQEWLPTHRGNLL